MKTNIIIQGDAIEELKKLPDDSIDLIVTDPPYYIPLTHYATRKYFDRKFADLGLIEHFFEDIFKEIKRIMKSTGIIYIFCNGQSYPLFWWHLFKFCKSVRPLIWDKKTSINGYSWRHQHELIIFAEMPKAKPIPSGDGDILRYSAVKVNERKHPAEKPSDLIERLISKSSKENDLILDMFAGGGVVMDVCKKLNKEWIMIEKEEEYVKIMKGKNGN